MTRTKSAVRLLASLLLAIFVGSCYVCGPDSENIRVSTAASSSQSETVSFGSLCVDEAGFEGLRAGKNRIYAQPLTKLCFNGNELFYDSEQRRWLYSLVEGESSAFDPVVDYSAEDKAYKLAFMSAGIGPDTLAEAKTIPVLIYTETEYFLCELSCTTLPVMNITTYGLVGFYEETRADIVLFDNRSDADERWVETEAFMHIRGGVTATLPKKGYKVSLRSFSEEWEAENRDLNLLGLRNDDDWHLSACYNDPERVRNALCSELWKQSCAYNNDFHVENGMSYKYIEVFMNGRYHGLYALGYPVDAKQLSIGKSVFGETEEYLYKKTTFANEKDFLNGTFEMPGYKIKGSYNGIEDVSVWQPLREFYKVKILEAAENPNRIYDIVDVDNMVDIHLFIQMVQGVDNIQNDRADYGSIKNMILALKNRDGEPVMLYTPWDLDMTWGNGYVSSFEQSYSWTYKYEPSDNLYMYYSPAQQLLNAGDPDIAGLLKARYAELRDDEWSEESLMELVDKYEEQVFFSGAFARDRERWPGSQHLDGVNDLSRLREYILARLVCMDQYVEALQ